MNNRLLICLLLLIWSNLAFANKDSTVANKMSYQVEVNAPSPLDDLLTKHLEMIKWRDNPRITPAEWQRLTLAASKNIKELLATEGYFSPLISSSVSRQNNITTATFTVTPGDPVLVSAVDIQFTGDIAAQDVKERPSNQGLREAWSLHPDAIFNQDDWDQAKRQLLTTLLIARYPNASISNSKATIDPVKKSAILLVEVDSGAAVRFGNLSVNGLKRYPVSIVENLNPIKAGSLYNQSDLLTFQARLQESGYFSSVQVTADTSAVSANDEADNQAPVIVTLSENKAIKVGVGAGFSTNTGARAQLTFDDYNLFNRGWRLTSSLKIEERAQSLTSQIRLPATSSGYRDSANATIDRSTIEGQTTTLTQAGIKRAWGPRKREQYVGANLLTEQVKVAGADSSSTYAATLAYGITLRRTDNELAPTRGYLINAQIAGAPIEQLSSGRFLQSYFKAQTYYPITKSTQLISRAEIGMVNGKNSAPATFLFRAGGDQSVRGYAFQSLGVQEGNATVGGRYLLTGSVEIVQWLTAQWGAAAFVDFGNAANTTQDLKPVVGYGLGARWKSPVGPIGADIAYGQETDEYRMHFNIGVAF